jgi:hypothetical protein
MNEEVAQLVVVLLWFHCSASSTVTAKIQILKLSDQKFGIESHRMFPSSCTYKKT